MKTFYTCVVKHRKFILVFFSICFAVCLFLQNFVSVNYDITDYLPKDTGSTVALDVMRAEFDGGIPNARIMIQDVTIPEALQYKEKIKAAEGVTEVAWLDDAADIKEPIEMLDADIVQNYYKNNTALFSATIAEDSRIDAVSAIREIIGEDNAMTGSAVSTAIATTSTVAEIQKITVLAVLFVLFVLFLTTISWLEPIIVLLGLGVAIILNGGSNLLFGEISFVTNAAGSILQLAVSLDYSVFLIHRFTECRKETGDAEKAMVNALCKGTTSILSSGLTTVIGFLALVLMRFRIGPDLGLALAKGVAISLVTVFLFMPALILTTYKWLDKTKHRPFMPRFKGFANFVLRIAPPMVCIFALLIAPSYLASNANSYYYGSSQIYGEGTTYGRDKTAIESVFGKKDTYVLLVPKGSDATEIELSKELKKIPEITEILSYIDTVGAEIPKEYLSADTLSLLLSEHFSRFIITVDTDYEGDSTFALVKQIRETAEKYYPSETHLAGEGVSAYDLMDTITADMARVNLLAIGAVFLVLLFTMKSLTVPIILVLCIETAIWLNLSVPYFSDAPIYYIAYLIISSVQLGATVDYAILMTDRYKENRMAQTKKEALAQTISDVMASILTSGSALTVVGLLLGYVSTNKLLSQLGVLIGRGAIFSLAIVLFVLPGWLLLFDKLIMTGGSFMTKHKKRITAAFLATLLMISILPAQAFATQKNTPKEEVVYSNLNADGSVKEINIVNIFNLAKKGKIIDYGEYESVRNMTTTDKIHYQNNMVTIDADVGKLYYEGKLKENVMPWVISIKYFMNGKEYSADKMAGRNGKLEIKTSIQPNKNCNSAFFEKYALQATFTLDTDKAANIVADGATMANVGSDKQLIYTILPGKGAEINITADVTNFEMESVSINGIPLALDIEVDDAALMERIAKLQEAVGALDNGMASLHGGIIQTQNALNALNAQSGTLRDSSAAFCTKGIAALQQNISVASYKALMSQHGLTIDDLKQDPEASLAIAATEAYLHSLSEAVNSLAAEYQKIDGGIATYTNTVEKIISGYAQVSNGVGKLKDSSFALRKETETMDAEIRDKVDELLEPIAGSDTETISFSSANNTNIKSVQFVIKTDSVKIIEKDVANTEPEATLNFWQKLLKLFDGMRGLAAYSFIIL